MSCTNCGEQIQGQCDVCKTVNQDTSFKLVVYCEVCQAYICQACDNAWTKRGGAAVVQKSKKIIEYIKNKFNGA